MSDRDREIVNAYNEIEAAAKAMVDNIKEYGENSNTTVNDAITQTRNHYIGFLRYIQDSKPDVSADLDKKEKSLHECVNLLQRMVDDGKHLKKMMSESKADDGPKQSKIAKNNSLAEYMNPALHHAKDVIKKHEHTSDKIVKVVDKAFRKL